MLLRGVSLDHYAEVENFKIIAGLPLRIGDPPRLAMIGKCLAEEHNAIPGAAIEIRGRNFKVVGIFSTGTYADCEAWISLADAQALAGWGSDVSIFVISSGGKLKAGDMLPGGLSVVQKGETGVNLVKEWQPVFNLLGLITATLGAAAAVALANMLWRLAWLQRRNIAIIQSIGFGKRAMAGFLLTQGASIALLGYGLGVLLSLAIGAVTQIKTAGISIHPVFVLYVLGVSFLFDCLITAAGSVLPAWWLAHLNLAMLLRSE